jgi:hypothetical protein
MTRDAENDNIVPPRIVGMMALEVLCGATPLADFESRKEPPRGYSSNVLGPGPPTFLAPVNLSSELRVGAGKIIGDFVLE